MIYSANESGAAARMKTSAIDAADNTPKGNRPFPVQTSISSSQPQVGLSEGTPYMHLLEGDVKSQVFAERGNRPMPQVKLVHHLFLKDEDRSPLRHG